MVVEKAICIHVVNLLICAYVFYVTRISNKLSIWAPVFVYNVYDIINHYVFLQVFVAICYSLGCLFFVNVDLA